MAKGKKVMALVLAGTMLAAGLAGCGSKEQASEGGKITLTWWTQNYGNQYISNFDEMEAYQKIQEINNVDIKYTHPVVGQEKDQFNIMVASGDYPDLIDYGWGSSYTGGVQRAIKDGVILDISDKIESLAPNYISMLKSNPDFMRTAKTVDGKLVIFNTIKNDIRVNSYYGPQLRKDWLDKLNLPVPETIEQWHDTLTAFKTQDPNGNGQADEVPLVDSSSMTIYSFSNAWGVHKGAFHTKADGTFVYGSIEPEFKEYLKTMNQWYNEGLIDPEFTSIANKNRDARMTNDTGGAYIGYIGSQMEKYLSAKADDPEYDIVAAPWPVGPAGKPYSAFGTLLRQVEYGLGTAITPQNKHVEESIKLLDFNYTEEGIMLHNWGIEGKSYVKDGDGYKFTDEILNNPEGKGVNEAIYKYNLAMNGGSGKVMDGDAYVALTQPRQQEKDAAEIWARGDSSLLTPSFGFTEEEATTVSKVMADVRTYENEMLTKMLIGLEPIDKFDEYVATIKNMGIDKVIQIYKTAYERYKAQA